LITSPTFGSTPVTWILWPNAFPSAPRTPETAETPGAVRTAASEAIPVGVKPFCDVSA
jgi:hypothetical protein